MGKAAIGYISQSDRRLDDEIASTVSDSALRKHQMCTRPVSSAGRLVFSASLHSDSSSSTLTCSSAMPQISTSSRGAVLRLIHISMLGQGEKQRAQADERKRERERSNYGSEMSNTYRGGRAGFDTVFL
ncbi:hypothetical protein D9C73_027400 [Collichthys lucidus]|uniref:Uncharacterized protein n=1 Tax=Collichthys lucidus TaxID=240159 RepID=A0A4U5VV19_COLLU|nr:hypothetical protein D9C73_027400 [Collichthys lucidus]